MNRLTTQFVGGDERDPHGLHSMMRGSRNPFSGLGNATFAPDGPGTPVTFNRPALRISALAALLAMAAGCGSEPAAETVPAVSAPAATLPPVSSTTTTEAATTTTALPPTTTAVTTTSVPRPPLPGALEEQVRELTARVEELRGREFPSPPLVVAEPPAPLQPLSPSQHERAFLELFNLIPPGADPDAFYRSYFSGRAAELPVYQPERERVMIPLVEADPPPVAGSPSEDEEAADGEGAPGPGREGAAPAGGGAELDEYQQWALAGALTRLLAAQLYPETAAPARAPPREGDPDRWVALESLLVGEATLVQTLYADGLPEERRAALAEQAAADAQPEFHLGPPFLVEQARFAAAAGSALALHLYRQEGTTGLDRALANPPVSTEQVLHPERYDRWEAPFLPEPFTVVLEGYETVEEGTWGERGWRSLLGGRGRYAQAADAARGWGGDRFVLLWNAEAERITWVVRYRGDTFADASRMASALVDLVGGLEVGISTLVGTTLEWPGGEIYALLEREGDVLTLVAAHDAEAGRRAAAQVRRGDGG